MISSDGQFALSSSWDHTLRLWDLNTGSTTRRFVGHTSDVLSVSFSADNRQIVSGSRDRTIKLWNTLGECKYDIKDDGHTEWYVLFNPLDFLKSSLPRVSRVSCVRFSPNVSNPVIVSCGWDKVVKVSKNSDRAGQSNLDSHLCDVICDIFATSEGYDPMRYVSTKISDLFQPFFNLLHMFTPMTRSGNSQSSN